MDGIVTAVSSNPTHAFSKRTQESIRLLAGLGVEGDAHLGETVKHRSRVAREPEPAQPAPGAPDPRRTARRAARPPASP